MLAQSPLVQIRKDQQNNGAPWLNAYQENKNRGD